MLTELAAARRLELSDVLVFLLSFLLCQKSYVCGNLRGPPREENKEGHIMRDTTKK
jgi:hypothetical protein